MLRKPGKERERGSYDDRFFLPRVEVRSTKQEDITRP